MTNEYNPDDTSAATLAAFVALGAQIVALRWELQQQRERADEYQRTAAHPARAGDGQRRGERRGRTGARPSK